MASFKLAIKLVKKAAKNGSDLIKLQTYKASDLTLKSSNPEFYIKGKIDYGQTKPI